MERSRRNALADGLADKNADVRYCAARGLTEIGPSARDAVPTLILTLNDKDESVRSAAVDALGEIGVTTGEVVCSVSFLLQDANASVRGKAATALGKFGAAAEVHRATLTEMLECAGAEVGPCVNPADALAALREDPDAWSLMVTDYDMQEMDGAALVQAARALRPDLPVLLISGYAQIAGVAPELARLAKPFRQSDLASSLASVMRAVPAASA